VQLTNLYIRQVVEKEGNYSASVFSTFVAPWNQPVQDRVNVLLDGFLPGYPNLFFFFFFFYRNGHEYTIVWHSLLPLRSGPIQTEERVVWVERVAVTALKADNRRERSKHVSNTAASCGGPSRLA